MATQVNRTEFDKLSGRVTALETAVAQLRIDVAGVRESASATAAGLVRLQGDVAGLAARVTTLESPVPAPPDEEEPPAEPEEPAPPPPPPVVAAPGISTVGSRGSIAKGSNRLNVDAPALWKIGDPLIVEVGAEPGKGQRGTAGVGGVWAAETTDPNLYFVNTDAPKALVAKVTGIESGALILDKAAAESTTMANVYYNCSPGIRALIGSGAKDLTLPAGRFAVSERIAIDQIPDFKIDGAGRDVCELFSPKGAACASIEMFESPRVSISGVHVRGNALRHGYGGDVRGKITEWGYPSGILFGPGSHNGIAEDVRISDVFQNAVATRFANDCWARRVIAFRNEDYPHYIGWQYIWANSQGGGHEDCEVISPNGLIAGAESFQSDGVVQRRLKTLNAVMSENSSSLWLHEDCEIRIAAGSWRNDTSFHRGGNPCVNINSNINNQQEQAGALIGGKSVRQKIIIEGAVDALGSSLRGLIVNQGSSGVIVDRLDYTAPDWKPGAINGPAGLVSTGEGTWAKDCVIRGINADGHGNIWIVNGDALNCTANRIDLNNKLPWPVEA